LIFPVHVRTRWIDFSPALRWYTARKIESALQPFASRIRSVYVRITDVPDDLDSRTCAIQVLIKPFAFASASATGADPYESVDRATQRVRSIVQRRLARQGSDEKSRVA
jgi:ribosome-associated translation inhibitor RaiA